MAASHLWTGETRQQSESRRAKKRADYFAGQKRGVKVGIEPTWLIRRISFNMPPPRGFANPGHRHYLCMSNLPHHPCAGHYSNLKTPSQARPPSPSLPRFTAPAVCLINLHSLWEGIEGRGPNYNYGTESGDSWVPAPCPLPKGGGLRKFDTPVDGCVSVAASHL